VLRILLCGVSFLAAAMTAGVARDALAQEWARKMFKITSHDFGSVARGAKSEFQFELTNLYQEDIHIAGVRASCGCTTPSITKDTLKTYEKGAVVAKFNTDTFLGHRTATITVTIDRPYYAEVQLQIQGNIRSDVVFSPGLVAFGEVEAGASAEKTLKVAYAGRSDWQISDVRSANSNLEVELNETLRQGGRVEYAMTVRLKPTAPAGYLNDELSLVTSDAASGITVAVEGRVVAPVSVSPASLFVGVLEPGQQVTKQLVVKSKKPFKIAKITCEDERFEFKTTDEAKALHLVPVTFKADNNHGQVTQKIKIETDLGGVTAELTATATIKAPVAVAGP
jgi:hypothetical protein